MMGKLIGDRKFYRMVMRILVPIMVQYGITNFVNLLDNIMVGQVGTEQMTGVAIVNQLMFVFNLCIFGATAGAGIFGAQFYGSGNHEGMRNTFRFKVIICGILAIIGMTLFRVLDTPLLMLFLHEGSAAGNIQEALRHGIAYLHIAIIGMVPFTIVQYYASTLREQGQTMMPMISGMVAVVVNMCLNAILIFGLFGAPRLEVRGAAIATVVSRFVEGIILVTWTHRHKEKNPFIVGVYRTLRIPAQLTKQICRKGLPLLANEGIWSWGMSMLLHYYSFKGIAVVAAMNISSTIENLFNVVFMSMGSAIGILVGQLLGAGKMKEARDTDTKLIFMSVVGGALVMVALLVIAPFFPQIYETTDEVRSLATSFIWIVALHMPIHAFLNAAYFTLRSGGNMLITFIFDCVFLWVVNIPLAYVLTHFTSLDIIWIFAICQLVNLIKCVAGYLLVKSGIWLRNMVSGEEAEAAPVAQQPEK